MRENHDDIAPDYEIRWQYMMIFWGMIASRVWIKQHLTTMIAKNKLAPQILNRYKQRKGSTNLSRYPNQGPALRKPIPKSVCWLKYLSAKPS